jgi:hypothetical protein
MLIHNNGLRLGDKVKQKPNNIPNSQDITIILLNVALNTHTPTLSHYKEEVL